MQHYSGSTRVLDDILTVLKKHDHQYKVKVEHADGGSWRVIVESKEEN